MQPPAPELLAGYVLCTVGPHRVAFAASEVVTIENYQPGHQAQPHARRAFALPELRTGRTLLSENGEGVVVDSLEVQQQRLSLLAPPDVFRGGAGGSVAGFARFAEKLWPVLELASFSRFLSALPAPDPGPDPEPGAPPTP